ncbi:lipoprotein [Roseateles sp. SL47]|uniref:LptM family lipoprotein n=1 Tax=Roseateles sp. SL47 TaxID=2995138 RepID=UPI00226FEC6A|nr:lipoprotein [Roseateles sp. SL47]WAC73267.1 lipoprotein [Roseateles sp. SL47]
MKTRSVGASAHRSQPQRGKALLGLMLSVALLGIVGCGQKRPLQLPPSAKAGTGGTGGATTPPAKAPAASAPASAAVMPQR